MRLKVECLTKIRDLRKSAKEIVDDAIQRGVDVLCVVDTYTAEGASAAINYVEQNNLPIYIVPGATVGISGGRWAVVYGAVNRVIVPSGHTLEDLKRHVELWGGFVADLPGTVEIEVANVCLETLLPELKKHDLNYARPSYDKIERRANGVWRHPAACNGASKISNPESLKHLAVGRVWKDEVNQFDLTTYPSVSIVIPVFNSPELLRNCLASLALTDYKGKCNLVLVDNGTNNPETLKLVKSAKATKLRFDQPRGFSEAVNAGVAKVKADYYVLLNQDTVIIDPKWLYALIRWMEFRPQCGVAGAKLLYPDGRLQHAGIDFPPRNCGAHRFLGQDPSITQVNYYERVGGVTGAVYCIRHDVFYELGGYDAQNYTFGCEDSDFSIRTQRAGYEVWYVPDSVVTHVDNGVRNDNPQDRGRILTWQHASDVKFYEMWGNYLGQCAQGDVSIVLPCRTNGCSGGDRVTWGLANSLISAGIETTLLTPDGTPPNDATFPVLFETKPLSSLRQADILIATRFDTVRMTKNIPARKRFYLVQQIETCMAKNCGSTEEEVLWSYAQEDYEILTIGEHLAARLRELGRNPKIVDVGFYRDLYPYVKRKKWGKRILMYGSGADYKGASEQTMIAEKLRKRFPGVKINSYHLDAPQPAWSDTHYRPHNTSEVAAVYADHDLYIYPSLSDGFAMTPIEAMACGIPVIMTDFPGKDQYAKDGINCMVVGYRNVPGIVNAVDELWDNPKLRAKIVESGLWTANQYDWSKVGPQYVREILG